MGIRTIHSEPLRRNYKASLCSFAVLFQLAVLGAVLVIPYATSYASAGMWVYERCYRQQASVQYKHDLIMVTRGSTDGSQLTWSTSKGLNRLTQRENRIPTVRSYEEDYDRDGKNEYLQLEVELPLADDESVQSVNILVLFDYYLNDMATISMESVGYLDYQASSPGKSLDVDGDLMLVQRGPLPWFGARDRYEEPVVDMKSARADEYQIAHVMQSYLNRNDTTDYVARSTVWRGDRAAGEPFTLKVRVRYPEQRVCYRPGFWQQLKFGWVQYVAFLIPTAYIGAQVRNFVFSNQIVETVVAHDPLLRRKGE